MTRPQIFLREDARRIAAGLVRYHFEEFVNRKNHDVVFETVAENFLDHDGPGGRPADREGDRQMMIALHRQIPDLHVSIEDLIVEEDKVVCRNAWTGTDSSARRIEFKGIVIWRIADGKLVERWATVTPPSITSAQTFGATESHTYAQVDSA